MQKRTNGIIRCTPAADYTEKEGYGVTIAAGVATLSASATVPVEGIILEGGTVAQGITVAIPGCFAGGLDVKLSGSVDQHAKIVQAADGTFVTDPGSGARVQIGLLNAAGVSGDLQEALPQTPLILS
jgi:hypothetical protein